MLKSKSTNSLTWLNNLSQIKTRDFSRWIKRHTKNHPFIESFSNNPINFIDDNKGKIWAVMNEIIRYYGKYNGNVFVSQDSLAQRVGLKSREQVNRIIKKLVKWGFISKVNRGKTSCRYRINAFFCSKIARSLLRYFFPAIICLTPNFVYSSESYTTDRCHTIYKRLFINNNNMYKSDELFKRFNFKTYQQKKNEEYYQKCEENREKGLQLLRESKKRDVLAQIVHTEKPTICKISKEFKHRPTVKDIPKKMLKQIDLLPENKKKEVANRVLKGMVLKWEHENEKNS